MSGNPPECAPNVDTFRPPGDGRGGQLLEVAPARNAPVVDLMLIMVTLPRAATASGAGGWATWWTVDR